MRGSRRSIFITTSKYILLALLVIFVAFPLYWMIVTSFKTSAEVYTYPPTLIPPRISFENYRSILELTDLGQQFVNSTIVAGISTILAIIIAAPCAYSLSRFRYFGLSSLTTIMLFVYMMPGILIVIPLFIIAHRIGVANSLPALIFIYLAFAIPVGTWLLRSYFSGIPRELEEAALVDGATRAQSLRLILLPLALPGIISTAVFTFIVAWNEYLFALVFLRSPEKWTLPLGLASMMGSERDVGFFGWELVTAAAVLITIPSLVYLMLTQRALIRGMGEGAVKG